MNRYSPDPEKFSAGNVRDGLVSHGALGRFGEFVLEKWTGRRGPNSPKGTPHPGPLLSPSKFRVSQPQSRGERGSRGALFIHPALRGAGQAPRADALKSSVQAHSMPQGGKVIALGLLKVFASNATRVSKENLNTTVWAAQTHMTVPTHGPRSFTKVWEKIDPGEGWGGEKKGDTF